MLVLNKTGVIIANSVCLVVLTYSIYGALHTTYARFHLCYFHRNVKQIFFAKVFDKAIKSRLIFFRRWLP